MRNLRIDVAGVADLEALVESASGLFQEDAGRRDPDMDVTWPAREGTDSYRRELGDPAALLLIARAGEQPVGHLVGKLHEPSSLRPARLAVLESMRVAPPARRQGVGAALVDAFFAWARTHGCVRARVTAYAANDRAQRFYARHGFAPHETTMAADLER